MLCRREKRKGGEETATAATQPREYYAERRLDWIRLLALLIAAELEGISSAKQPNCYGDGNNFIHKAEAKQATTTLDWTSFFLRGSFFFGDNAPAST